MNLEKKKEILDTRCSTYHTTPYFAHFADSFLGTAYSNKAIEILEKGLKSDPNNAVAHYILGKVYYQHDQLNDARSELERAIKLYPDLINAYMLLIKIETKNKRFSLVSQYKKKMSLSDPFFDSNDEKKNPDIPELPRIKSSVEAKASTKNRKKKESPIVKKKNTPPKNVEKVVDETIHQNLRGGHVSKTIKRDELIEASELSNAENSIETISSTSTSKKKDSLSKNVEMKEGDLVNQNFRTRHAAKTIKNDFFNHTNPVSTNIKISNEPRIEQKSEIQLTGDFLSDELDVILKEASKTEPIENPDGIVSPTLGEIYLSQGQFSQAHSVFRQLLDQDPQNSKLKQKLSSIEKLLNE